METIDLGRGIQLPLSELDFSFARSGGPGGQHVNRAETKVELRWDVAASPSLDEGQRARVREELASYITDDGVLRLSSGETRSQHRNREAVVARLQALMARALQPRRSRRPTRPSRSARERRLDQKRARGEKKARRGKLHPRDY